MIRFIHTADWHLDSAFGGLSPDRAARRRRESREMPMRLAEYVRSHGVDLVLLSGDLFDTVRAYRDTTETLSAAFARMEVPVLAAPGNHDCLAPGSAWDTADWPDNVHLFREGRMTAVDFPRWNLTVHGGAFTGPDCPESLLSGFTAPADGRIHIGLLHGEVEAAESRYNSIRRQDIAASGLAYLALGHIHKRIEPQKSGNTLWAWPGCMEGRGFDELGAKGFVLVNVENQTVSHEFVPFARRTLEEVAVDITDLVTVSQILAAAEVACGGVPAENLVKLTLTGAYTLETQKDLQFLKKMLEGRFWFLKIKDESRLKIEKESYEHDLSLKGEFIRLVMASNRPEEEKERMILCGIRALGGEEVAL